MVASNRYNCVSLARPFVTACNVNIIYTFSLFYNLLTMALGHITKLYIELRY